MAERNWAGNVTFAATELAEPRSVGELQELLAAATGPVKAIGSRHSFSTVADTTGTLVSVRSLPFDIEVDSAARRAWVPGGATYAEIAEVIDPAGWALPNLGSLPHISAAGAAATGTHGSGNDNTCQAAAVEAVEFVRADGELVRVGRGDDGFGGSVLALGALGVVTHLELALVPTFDVRQDVYVGVPSDAIGPDVFAAGHSVSVFTDLKQPGRTDSVWVKTRSADAPEDERWGGRLSADPVHPVPGADAAPVTVQGVTGPWHERLPHFRAGFRPSVGHEVQSEYLIPRAALPDALAALEREAAAIRPALHVCELRTVAADDLWLSPCRGRETGAVHFTWVDDEALVSAALRRVEDAFAPFDPRPHWGKVFLDPPPADAYPQLGAFRALAARHDPERRFANDFLVRYVL